MRSINSGPEVFTGGGGGGGVEETEGAGGGDGESCGGAQRRVNWIGGPNDGVSGGDVLVPDGEVEEVWGSGQGEKPGGEERVWRDEGEIFVGEWAPGGV